MFYRSQNMNSLIPFCKVCDAGVHTTLIERNFISTFTF